MMNLQSHRTSRWSSSGSRVRGDDPRSQSELFVQQQSRRLHLPTSHRLLVFSFLLVMSFVCGADGALAPPGLETLVLNGTTPDFPPEYTGGHLLCGIISHVQLDSLGGLHISCATSGSSGGSKLITVPLVTSDTPPTFGQLVLQSLSPPCMYAATTLPFVVDRAIGVSYVECSNYPEESLLSIPANGTTTTNVLTPTQATSCLDATGPAFGPALVANNGTVIGGCSSGGLFAINSIGNFVHIVTSLQCPYLLALTVNKNTGSFAAFCTNQTDFSISFLHISSDLSTVTVIASSPGGVGNTLCPWSTGQLGSITMSDDGTIFATCRGTGGGAYKIVGGGTSIQLLNLTVCSNGFGNWDIATNAAGSVIYTNCFNQNAVMRVRVSDGFVSTMFPTCGQPYSLAHNTDTGVTVVSCRYTSDVQANICRSGASLTAYDVCLNCTAGMIKSQPGNQPCQNCSAGHFSAVDGSTVCSACSAGTFSLPGASICSACSSGYYQSVDTSSSCNLCLAGSYTPDATSCVQCGLGKYSAQNGTGTGGCSTCGANTYQPTMGQTGCLSCPGAASGSSTCFNGGGSSTGGGVRVCTVTGTYSSTSINGNLTCLTCPAGSYCPSPTDTTPTICPIGQYCSAGVSNPTPCTTGHSASTVGSVSCGACPRSSWSNTTGSTTCILCSSGLTTDLVASIDVSQCKIIGGCSLTSPCPLGSTQPISSQSLLSGSGTLLARVNSTLTDLSLLYFPLRESPSLRLAVTGSDATLTARNALHSTPDSSTTSNTPSQTALPSIIVIVSIALLIAAFVPLFLYRLVPAKLALLADQFSFQHSTAVGNHPRRYPTQFGAMLSWTFICFIAIIALVLATLPSTSTNSSLVPPSRVSNAGTATSDFELTMRVYSNPSTVASSCSSLSTNAFNLVSQNGFSKPVSNVQTIPSAAGDSCSVVVDCTGCQATGVKTSLIFEFPFDAQLIEYEIWCTSSTPGQWSRLYGIVQQPNSNQLLDAVGILEFNLLESYYDNDYTNELGKSGYEISYLGYSRSSPQLVSNFTSLSRVQVELQLTKDNLVYSEKVTVNQSPIQRVSLILSTIGTLFSILAIVFGLIEEKVLKDRAGQVAMEDGKVYLVKGTTSVFSVAAKDSTVEMS